MRVLLQKKSCRYIYDLPSKIVTGAPEKKVVEGVEVIKIIKVIKFINIFIRIIRFLR